MLANLCRRYLRIVLASCLVLALAPLSSASAASQQAAVQTHLFWGISDAEVDRQLDAVAASGATITRVDLGWQSLQQNNADTYEQWFLTMVDRVVAQADARGIKPFFTVLGTPCWASTAPETLKQNCAGAWWDRGVQTYAPARATAYGKAVAFLAARYRDKVAGWELWNEPNHADFFKATDQAASYAELVKTAYPMIKQADPAAVVVVGAVSLADTAFVERLFGLGISGSLDAFSIHPYSHDRSPLELGTEVLTSFVRGVPAVHDLMLRYGSSKPMWLTEAGFSTSTVRGYAWESGVSEADQAVFLEQQFQQIRQWSYVAVGVWYMLKDYTSNTADLWGNTGLLRYDGSAKPAYAAFQRAAASLAVTPPPPTGCGLAQSFSGSLSATGASAIHPNGTSYTSTTGGAHRGCLRGPASANFDLYLDKRTTKRWTQVARAISSTSNEDVSYSGTAGTYRWRVVSSSGSGSYTFELTKPS